jgi:hypothetical protein
MKEISILVPTRNRVDLLKGMVSSVFDTAADKEAVEVLCYVDEDDENTKKIIGGLNARCFVEPRLFNIQKCVNFLCGKANGQIVMYGNDDIVFRTPKWDSIVKEVFDRYDDKIALCYGYDGIQPKGWLSTFGFVHKNWVNVIGYVLNESFPFDYSDGWINDVAKVIDRNVYVDIYIEHLHSAVEKRPYGEVEEWKKECKKKRWILNSFGKRKAQE